MLNTTKMSLTVFLRKNDGRCYGGVYDSIEAAIIELGHLCACNKTLLNGMYFDINLPSTYLLRSLNNKTISGRLEPSDNGLFAIRFLQPGSYLSLAYSKNELKKQKFYASVPIAFAYSCISGAVMTVYAAHPMNVVYTIKYVNNVLFQSFVNGSLESIADQPAMVYNGNSIYRKNNMFYCPPGKTKYIIENEYPNNSFKFDDSVIINKPCTVFKLPQKQVNQKEQKEKAEQQKQAEQKEKINQQKQKEKEKIDQPEQDVQKEKQKENEKSDQQKQAEQNENEKTDQEFVIVQKTKLEEAIIEVADANMIGSSEIAILISKIIDFRIEKRLRELFPSTTGTM
jgi:hypothetical protein